MNIIAAKAILTAEDKSGPAFKSMADRFKALGRSMLGMSAAAKAASTASSMPFAQVDKGLASIKRATLASREFGQVQQVTAAQTKAGAAVMARAAADAERQAVRDIASMARQTQAARELAREKWNLARQAQSASRAAQSAARGAAPGSEAHTAAAVARALAQERVLAARDAGRHARRLTREEMAAAASVEEGLIASRRRTDPRAPRPGRRGGGAEGFYRQGFGSESIASDTAHLAAGMTLAAGARGAIREQARFQHERVRMDVSGMSEHDIDEAAKKAGELSSKYRAFGQTDIAHMIRNAQSVVGSFEEATHIIDPMLKLRTVALGANPHKATELNEDFDKLIKGMEIKGVTQDMGKFVHYMDGMARAVNVFGDTLRPTDYYEMFKYGRQATTSLSDKFMLKTAPTLAQELGGSSTGTALSTLYGTLVGGKIKDVAANELDKYGLIDRTKVRKLNKTGQIMGLHPGGVKGTELAASDPYAWVNDVFLPALKAKGVTDNHKIQEIIATVFRDRTAAQMVSIFATQQARIEKDWHLVEKARGLEAADQYMGRDPYVAAEAVKQQALRFGNSANLVEGAAFFMNNVAKGLALVTDSVNRMKDRQHAISADPEAAARDGRARVNALFGDPNDQTRPGADVLGWLRNRVEPGAIRAHRDKVERDRIDVRRAELDREAVPHQRAIDEIDEIERTSGSNVLGRGMRARERAEAVRRLDDVRRRRAALDESVRAHDSTSLDLTEVEIGQDRVRGLRFARGAASPAPLERGAGRQGFGLFGPQGAGGDQPWNGPRTVTTPEPPRRPDAQAPAPAFDLAGFLGGGITLAPGQEVKATLTPEQLVAQLKPDQVQANVRPDQIQATAKLEGQGVIVVRAEPGTQVVSTIGSGHLNLSGGRGTSMPGATNTNREMSPGGRGGV